MTDTDYQPIGRIKGHPRVRRPKLPRTRTQPSAGRGKIAAGGLVEWHDMSPSERAANWAKLCNWVTWLYDRYELSVESRLPECWTEHPGMIEELWALMVWRFEIYGSELPAGQAARYWHTELRVVTANAASYYASNCRTGHRKEYAKAADDKDLQKRWNEADPALGIPKEMLPTENAALAGAPGTMPAEAMRVALASGAASVLSPAIPEYARYDAAWWLDAGEDTWVLVTDAAFAEKLDASAAAMEAATAATQRRKAAQGLSGDARADQDRDARN
ncbi:hypothetical protein [Streptacidiphilus sp. EB129]|uniref:hypothetical protein n=1 Tax=Streptacidiphilus sp. EB129 TaxID=3156262 RepID=UPI003519610F